MKIFFDTNVYIAEALLGRAASRLLTATRREKFRIYTSDYLLHEIVHVLVDELGFSKRLAILTQRRALRHSTLVNLRSTAKVKEDPKDSPILQAALSCGADYLVTNDRHLLALNPFEGLRIISMGEYYHFLQNHASIK